jgi:alkylhydroperoxidase family enzyme
VREHGRVTNMKRTLGRSLLSYQSLLTWYPLRDEVAAFLGDRATYLFAHAISSQNDCLICTTFFRRIFIEDGENPDSFALSAWEETIVAYGRALARDPHGVSDELYAALAARLDEAQIVALTAFGAIMIATNVFNDALRVDLDENLYAYR